MEEAVTHAKTQMTDHIRHMAQAAGATDIIVELTTNDHAGTLAAGKTQEQFLDTEIIVIARGHFDDSKQVCQPGDGSWTTGMDAAHTTINNVKEAQTQCMHIPLT